MNLHSVIFYSYNLAAVKAFYIDNLGFSVEYETPQFLSLLITSDSRLGIKLSKEEREIPGSQTMMLHVDDLEQWFLKLKQLPVRFSKELKQEPWGMEFSILDPDGNKVIFR